MMSTGLERTVIQHNPAQAVQCCVAVRSPAPLLMQEHMVWLCTGLLHVERKLRLTGCGSISRPRPPLC